ncbi:hypothetical protein SKAU_G00295890 [Synaphobranchus kaupii]|uniref:Rab-GAP TBC domain-containing protein n=1 Tax=Synaphobranchus kaupii TaxID=118154 RepID=A0A9Q1EUN9_SYNKA|nr:hypothetical protein SKAU_G00295890 [Synaphobranchus kaupii]
MFCVTVCLTTCHCGHYEDTAILAPQEPYVFGQRAQAAMRGALTFRYSLLPLLYTLFPPRPRGRQHRRPAPLPGGSVELAVYLPPGTWYSLPDGQPFHSRGQYLLLPAPLDTINVHLREGHIIPQQEPALTTVASRTNPFLLTVALSAEGWARGELFWDDGDSLDTFEMGDYSYLLFIAGEATLVSQPLKTNGALDGLVLGEVRIFGVPSPPLDVWVNGERLRDFSYRSDTQVLTVPSLVLPMAESFTMHWRLDQPLLRRSGNGRTALTTVSSGAEEDGRSVQALEEMSLGRLLRRASSKASDLLTFNAGSAGSRSVLDGEIIFSKNNVCVHPTEPLPGLAEHHPGYLCVHLEKDEALGSTLILTWVPNSRIQRQDEEALRYITPESSPVRRNPRRRPHRAHSRPPPAEEEEEEEGGAGDGEGGAESQHQQQQQQEEGDEGSCDLSADEVSRDSTLGSDSDTFSSPFCLSPVSEALAESSGSVFLDNENRDMCDESMTHSASSASSLDSHAPSENSQSQGVRWEEQQKVMALEQLCGVFRVDLGHMRSLRLFFSDEACTSGQLVIASRESQYKILHFHHAGLDKLAEVFQQWKYCRETQLKDQVSEEKSCMQFSIRRPTLPSAETHPEERLYRRLDVATWLRHLNHSGQVEEEYKLRKAIFFGGIDPAIRGEVWPFLLQYYSCDSTSEEREAWRLQKRSEYQEIQHRRLAMSPEEHSEFWRKVQFTVDKDVVRTDRSNPFYRGENNPNVEIMRRILLNYAVFNPDMGYCQGMSDLVAPLLTEVQDESDTFWCFVGLMENTIFISSPRDEDMERQLMYLRELLRLMLPGFHQHLTQLGEDGLQLLFCHRWVLLCFKREFPDTEALRMWEACWAHYQTDYFHLFLCVAIIVLYGEDVSEQQLATDQMLLHFSNLSMHMNGDLVLRKARSLLYQFRLLPRIPCSLHDLCKLCGPGMWDSRYIPAVECSGEHPDSQSCPYGGTVTPLPPPSPLPPLPHEGKRGSKTRDIFNFRKQS